MGADPRLPRRCLPERLLRGLLVLACCLTLGTSDEALRPVRITYDIMDTALRDLQPIATAVAEQLRPLLQGWSHAHVRKNPSARRILIGGPHALSSSSPTSASSAVYSTERMTLPRLYCVGRNEEGTCISNNPYTVETCDGLPLNASYLESTACSAGSGFCLSQTNDGVLADLIILLALDDETNACEGRTARAVPCLRASNARPIAGAVRFCTTAFLQDDAASHNLLLHETIHALGLADAHAPFFRECTPATQLENCTLRDANTVVVAGEGNRYYANLSTARNQVQALFGCSEHQVNQTPGVLLEQATDGREPPPLDHWEFTLFPLEIMTINWNSPMDRLRTLTRITLAALQDTGWYLADLNGVPDTLGSSPFRCRQAWGECGRIDDNSHYPASFFCDPNQAGALRCYPQDNYLAACIASTASAPCAMLTPINDCAEEEILRAFANDTSDTNDIITCLALSNASATCGATKCLGKDTFWAASDNNLVWQLCDEDMCPASAVDACGLTSAAFTSQQAVLVTLLFSQQNPGASYPWSAGNWTRALRTQLRQVISGFCPEQLHVVRLEYISRVSQTKVKVSFYLAALNGCPSEPEDIVYSFAARNITFSVRLEAWTYAYLQLVPEETDVTTSVSTSSTLTIFIISVLLVALGLLPAAVVMLVAALQGYAFWRSAAVGIGGTRGEYFLDLEGSDQTSTERQPAGDTLRANASEATPAALGLSLYLAPPPLALDPRPLARPDAPVTEVADLDARLTTSNANAAPGEARRASLRAAWQ
ncbi:uncharacterized protein MONBRDRAFT_6773 [Monosiga brevicollis MX1]|uniref:Leishmanolysin-like peptidase n=1 Tax=Monosiga brevicollis TaxID=81824 RepID=A9UV97_MONBE|nr:uncharacterized protein MONBRDRAFT_6773 [Monosiga brevicollis MX1]EDQ91043.1 predicted protein [Monosiga brevicollis MX1]|eukprot:XP_001744340.1 hypothetical protein [Monosiga brevicollis MX1]